MNVAAAHEDVAVIPLAGGANSDVAIGVDARSTGHGGLTLGGLAAFTRPDADVDAYAAGTFGGARVSLAQTVLDLVVGVEAGQSRAGDGETFHAAVVGMLGGTGKFLQAGTGLDHGAGQGEGQPALFHGVPVLARGCVTGLDDLDSTGLNVDVATRCQHVAAGLVEGVAGVYGHVSVDAGQLRWDHGPL